MKSNKRNNKNILQVFQSRNMSGFSRMVVFILLAGLMQYSYSQEFSIDNYTGLWSSDNTWVSGTAPNATGINIDINIFGFVSRYGTVEFQNGDLYVYDTLVIYGDLNFKNQSNLYLGAGSILIVYGNYTSWNKVDVENGGTMVVTGEWEMLGSDDWGSFDNDGQLYILDPDPDLKTGDGFEDFWCTAPVDSCQQYGLEDLIGSDIGDFFSGGSYKIDTSGVTTFCPGGSVTLSTTDTASNYQWYQDSVAISGETTYYYTAIATGEYYVEFEINSHLFSLSAINVTGDTISPVINTCATNKILSANAPCQIAVPDLSSEIGATDNCDASLTITQFPTAGTMIGLGITPVTIYVTDDVLNVDSCTINVTVIDDTDPTITAPAGVSVGNDSGVCTASGVALGSATTDDNCGVASVTNDALATYPLGETIVTWIVTDNTDNTATALQTVTVTDNELPTITAPADLSVNNTPGVCGATGVAIGTATADDNCNVASVTNDAPATFPIGETTVTWTVEDDAGLTASSEQKVTVTDNEAPTITAPAVVSVNNTPGVCGATGVDIGTATANDNCNVASVTNDAPATFPIGETTVIWTAEDDAGLTTSATQTVTVTDNEPPTITTPAVVSVNNTPGVCGATGVDIGTATADDNCNVASVTNDAPATFPIGETLVTWTTEDDAGLTATATQKVTVTDNEVPTITAPADVGVNNTSGICGATGVDIGTATANDNCNVTSVTNDAPATFPIGETTVTWTAEDDAGLTTSAIQTVTVTDNEPPTITAPAVVSVNNTPGVCGATGVDIGTATADDNCNVASVTNDAPATFPIGETTVIWTAEDDAGLTTSATQTVTVTDNEPPTITAPAVVGVNNTSGICGATGVDIGTATADDNCNVASVTNDAPATFPIGETLVTWTTEDDAGLTATATQKVTVTDNEVPTITAPADVDANNNPGSCNATGIDLGSATTDDNCGVASIVNNAPAMFLLGPTTVIWIATDNSGNSATANQTVTVTDTESPTITAPADVNVNSDFGVCTASGVVLGSALTADNCGISSTVNDAPAIFPSGITTVTWIVTDHSGLTGEATQTVTVSEIEDPVISNCPSDINVPADDEYCGSNVTWTAPTATDNCSVTLSSNHNPGDFFAIGTTTVIYTATDGSGNSVSCSFDVTVDEPQAITIDGKINVCSPGDETYSVSGMPGKTFSWSVSEGAIVGSATSEDVVISWTGLTPGIVSVDVSSGSGCSASGSLNVIKAAGPETSEIRSEENPTSAPGYLSEVCAGETNLYYSVTGLAGSTYAWIVNGGSKVSDFGDSIIVDWGQVPGEYEISVAETSLNGCLGAAKTGTVLIVAISVELGDDQSICEGETFILTPTGEFQTIVWQDGSSTIPYEKTDEGPISCTVYHDAGCSASDEMYLTVNESPYVDLGNDTAVCGKIILDAGADGTIYNWSTGETTQEIEVSGQHQISVDVENVYGCIAQDTIYITACDMDDYFSDIPNIITPNEDGKNDQWIVEKLSGFPDVEVEIYDRWGRLIYRSETGYPTPWNGINMHGNIVPTGSYHYVFLLNYEDYKRVTGSVSVIK